MIDTHAHLFMCSKPIEELVENALNAGVKHMVHVATTLDSGFESLQSAKDYACITPTIGFHPSEPNEFHRLDELDEALSQHAFKAIGETGLDAVKQYCPMADQKANFIGHLDLARKHNLPVIIHNRHTEALMMEILPKYKDVKKVIHCFTSTWEFAQAVNDEFTYFSFTGAITGAKRGKTINALRRIPMNKIMIETDCPFLIPDAFRGKENEPAFVSEIARKIADVKDMPLDDVEAITDRTAKAFFNIA